MSSVFLRLWRDSSGASLIDYSFLIGIIIALVVVAVALTGIWISGSWASFLSALSP